MERARQRERTGRGRQRIARRDVVLDEDGDPVQRAAQLAGAALRIKHARCRQRVGVDRKHRAVGRTRGIKARDARQISADQRRRAQRAGERRLQLRDRPFGRIEVVRPRAVLGARQRLLPGDRGTEGAGPCHAQQVATPHDHARASGRPSRGSDAEAGGAATSPVAVCGEPCDTATEEAEASANAASDTRRETAAL
jgi:hypothetical protein